MRKILLLLSILCSSMLVFSQTNKDYYAASSANSMFARILPKTTLFLPTGCGAPSGTASIKSDTTNRSAVYYDSCGHRGYFWDPATQAWFGLPAGATVDSAYARRLISLAFSSGTFTATLGSGQRLDVSLDGRWLKIVDTGAMLANRLKISDTATMVSNRYKISDTANAFSGYLRKNWAVLYTDSAAMLANRLKISDTTSAFSGYLRKNWALLLQDTSSAFGGYARSGNVVKYTDIGVNNGVAGLDAGGKVPFSQLPATLMIYKGTWNPSTNTPTLSDGSGTSGWVYKASVNGTVNLGSGSITFLTGDFIIYNGSTWERSAGTDNVVSVSVNGSTAQQGVVSITLPNSSVTDAMLAHTFIKLQTANIVGTTQTGGAHLSDSLMTDGQIRAGSDITSTAGSLEAAGAVRLKSGSYYALLSKVTQTADHTISLPNASGTIALTDGTGASGTWAINISGNAASLSAVLSASLGGAGSVSGIMKANGSGTVSAAIAGTDYQIPYWLRSGNYLLPVTSGDNLTLSTGELRVRGLRIAGGIADTTNASMTVGSVSTAFLANAATTYDGSALTAVTYIGGVEKFRVAASLVTVGTAFTAGSNSVTGGAASFTTGSFTTSLNGIAGIDVTNSSTGGSAEGGVRYHNSGSTVAWTGLASTSRTTYVNLVANALGMYTDNVAGVSILVDANGPFTVATNSLVRLTVTGAGAIQTDNSAQAQFIMNYTGTGALKTSISAFNGTAAWYDETNGRYIWKFTPSNAYLTTAVARVGIGTTSPADVLTVLGGSNNTGLEFGNAGASEAYVQTYDRVASAYKPFTVYSSDFTANTQGTRAGKFQSNTSGTMYVQFVGSGTGNGYIGIGSSIFSGGGATDFGLNSDGALKFATNGGTVGLTINTSQASTFAGTLGINGTSDNIKSGTYTPSATNVSNTGSYTAGTANYIRVGNAVTVSGIITVGYTSANTLSQFYLNLPINSNLTGQLLGGAGAADAQGAGLDGNSCNIASGTANRAYFTFKSGATTSGGYNFAYSYTYTIN